MNTVYYAIAASVASVTLIGTAVTIGIAWGTLSQRQKSHEERDTERFAEVSSTLKEIQADVKTILSTH